LKDKGHLGVGADADIAIYDIEPRRIDPSRDYRIVRRTLKKAAYTIKAGEIVAKDGTITKSVPGRTLWADLEVPSCVGAVSCPEVLLDLKKRSSEYWTVEIENYFVPERFLANSAPIPIKSEV